MREASGDADDAMKRAVDGARERAKADIRERLGEDVSDDELNERIRRIFGALGVKASDDWFESGHRERRRRRSGG